MKRYGRHKAWIDPVYKFEGKPVILVYNAWKYAAFPSRAQCKGR